MRLRAAFLSLLLLLAFATAARSGDDTGWASHYGPGNGVAMHFCTWTLRHSQGCGSVRITSLDTGKSVVAPVIDYCLCHVEPSSHPDRIVDLQWGVVDALGLRRSTGLYQVTVERLTGTVPDTAMRPEVQGWIAVYALLVFACFALLLGVDRRR